MRLQIIHANRISASGSQQRGCRSNPGTATGDDYWVHNMSMARGWESKSVESRIESKREEAESRKAARSIPPLTDAEVASKREIEMLELSRTRVLADLARATNPRYRAQLEAALKHLDAKLGGKGLTHRL